MCFHTKLSKEQKKLEERFKAYFEPENSYQISYHTNGFSNSYLYIITQEEPNKIIKADWGMLPNKKYDKTTFKKNYNTLNAKSETIFEKQLYEEAILSRRCLIISDGFFESKKVNNVSFPHLVQLENHKEFVFAGIYNLHHDGKMSCSILTIKANNFMSLIHNEKKRMPIILDASKEQVWLENCTGKQELVEIINNCFTTEELIAHPISKELLSPKVNSNHNNIVNKVYYQELDSLF